MKIYILHCFKEFDENEKYAWASAHKTREEAERELRHEIDMAVEVDADGEDFPCPGERARVVDILTNEALEAGDELHDAILCHCDFTLYLDITETEI